VPFTLASRTFNSVPPQRLDQLWRHSADIDFFQKTLAGALTHGLLFLGQQAEEMLQQPGDPLQAM
jgi:hypothetical protein